MAILRRIKEKVKDLFRGKDFVKKSSKAAKNKEEPKDSFSSQQTAVETAKYSYPQDYRMRRGIPDELPGEYHRDRIVLQVRDPWWIHTYWEVTAKTYERFKRELGDQFYRAKRTLRVYDVSNINFDGGNAHRHFDIAVNDHASSWYIDTAGPGRSWIVDFGLLLPDGRFITIVRSNVVHTPLDGPSWITDEEWMIPDEMFARLYGIGFGSSPVKIKKLWEQRLARELGSGFVSSSPVRKPLEKGFWLVVNTELIVYGATEPDAKVTVQGRDIKLRPDGTFSLRFALPDGKQIIPVKAVSNDRTDERTITPIVTRETR